MNARQLVKNAPNWALVVCGTVVFVTITAAFVVLSVTGSDATDFSRFLNIIMNTATVLLAGGGFIAGTAAARSAEITRRQTRNGKTDAENEEAENKEVDVNG